jgi:hypothetical protein
MNILNTLRTEKDGTYNSEIHNQDPLRIIDHALGFDKNFQCKLLDDLHDQTLHRRTVATEYIFNQTIKDRYPKFDFVFDVNSWYQENGIENLQVFEYSSKKNLNSFACSFNNTPHIGRKLLTSSMHYYGFFNPETCSKTFTLNPYEVIGTLYDYVGDRAEWYKKFFDGKQLDQFYQTRYVFGPMVSRDHSRNQQHLKSKIDQSFLHLVSETMPTSYYPFVTEKFLYSVAQKGLFLAYAQPKWHQHVLYYYGFRRYNKIFNYDFDFIFNPVQRLITMLDMISKFSKLSPKDWQDLYEIEKETIEYNFEHFVSGNYLKHLEKRVSKKSTMLPFDEKVRAKIKFDKMFQLIEQSQS